MKVNLVTSIDLVAKSIYESGLKQAMKDFDFDTQNVQICQSSVKRVIRCDLSFLFRFVANARGYLASARLHPLGSVPHASSRKHLPTRTLHARRCRPHDVIQRQPDVLRGACLSQGLCQQSDVSDRKLFVGAK